MAGSDRHAREEPRWRELPIVALTANAGLEDRQRCLGAGMNDVLTEAFGSPTHRVLKEHAVATRCAQCLAGTGHSCCEHGRR